MSNASDSACVPIGGEGGAARSVEITDLPTIDSFGVLSGRDSFRTTCRTLFSRPEVRFVRNQSGQLIVFRHQHLRTLATLPAAGNVPPDVLARGSFEAVRDARTAPAGRGAATLRILANQIFFNNAPLHDPARRILTKQLSPKAVQAFEPIAESLIARRLDDIIDAGEIDFQRDFSDALTCQFWGAMVGMTGEETAALVDLIRSMSGLFYAHATRDDVYAYDLAADGYARIVAGAARRALASGGFPFVEAVASDLGELAFEDDPARAGIVPRDVGDYLAGNLFDAFHTSALGASNVVYAILRHRGVLDQLRADRSLLPAAVFEGLRLEAPVLHLNRYALEEIVLDGLRIPKGDTFIMCWGAGNLDPQAFPEPERFRLDRPMRGSTTFGAGAQICPGRIAAFMLAQKTIDALVSQDLEVRFRESDCDWYEAWGMAQLKRMPLEIRRAGPISPAG
jgi:cytochrome P450